MLRFISKLFNIQYRTCEKCEMLEYQLEVERQENNRLLDALLNIAKPEIVQAPPAVLQNVPSKIEPWRVRKEKLEKASFEDAAALRARSEEEQRVAEKLKAQIENAEKETGIADNG